MSGPAAGALRRSVLFVPADRPERFSKAVAAGPDAVCVDLEDGVAAGAKERARAAALETLAGWRAGQVPPPGNGAAFPEVVLRIHAPGSPEGDRDLEVVGEGLRGGGPDLVMLPKVDGADELQAADSVLGGVWPDARLIPQVETLRGLAAAEAIAGATPRIAAVLFGGVDLSAALGCALEWEPLLYARSRVVHAAALAGVHALDSPWLDVSDADGLEAEARRVARLGYAGKAAIHPTQVEPIHRAFTPAAADVDQAARIVEAYEAAGGGVLLLDGRLVERPVVERARRVLALARAAPEGRLDA